MQRRVRPLTLHLSPIKPLYALLELCVLRRQCYASRPVRGTERDAVGISLAIQLSVGVVCRSPIGKKVTNA